MRRFLLDTGIAGDFIDHRRGVYDHARQEFESTTAGRATRAASRIITGERRSGFIRNSSGSVAFWPANS
jgi:hypothetical protein